MLSCQNRAKAPLGFILLGWAKSRAETLSQEGPTYIGPLVDSPFSFTRPSFRFLSCPERYFLSGPTFVVHPETTTPAACYTSRVP